MAKLLNFARPSRASRGFPGRRGTVLIMCVVLIVILALIGTAMLSTARIDRYTSTQHSYNVQIEMLIEGAKNVAKSVIVGDLYGTQSAGPPIFRPAVDSSATGGTPNTSYDHWDAPVRLPTYTFQNDIWLADLAPTLLVSGFGGIPLSWPVYWPVISGPIAAGSFEAPDTGPIAVAPRLYMAPTVKRINYPDGSRRDFPALVPLGSGGLPILAADADGDGTADALMSRLVPGEINGVTYFVSYRIVDNAAKINVNMAWTRSNDFNAAGFLNNFIGTFGTPLGTGSLSFAGNLGVNRGNVGLMELLRVQTPGAVARADPNAVAEMKSLNRFRSGYEVVPPLAPLLAYKPWEIPVEDPDSTNGQTPTQRTDFKFVTQLDAFEHQLARRIGNPGYNVIAGAVPEEQRYQAFPAFDSAALAYRFVLLNLDASPSTLENVFERAYNTDYSQGNVTSAEPDSVYRSAANYVRTGTQVSRIAGQRSYLPNQVGLWYDQNFNLDRATGPLTVPSQPGAQLILDGGGSGLPPEYVPFHRPIRPIITTSNPVSNQITVRSTTAGGVTLPDTTWMEPYRAVPAKTNVNTASFKELYRAFWCVMSENTASGTPFAAAYEPVADGVFYGMEFVDAYPFDPEPLPPHPQRMFRTIIRDPRGAPIDAVYIKNSDMVTLRAAIAATQTMQMRDPITVVRQAITLPVTIGSGTTSTSTSAVVSVFGHRQQPFITEVFAHTDLAGPGGAEAAAYVAIELYNPYPDAIRLDSAWRIVTIQRKQTMTAYPLPPMNVVHTFSPLIIPAGGYLLLENFDGSGTPRITRPKSSRLPETGPITSRPDLTVAFVPNLHQVLDNEMFILQDESGGAYNLDEQRPVDSYDFSELTTALASATHYARPNDALHRWHWVYPGRYYGDFDRRRQQGTQYQDWVPLLGGMDPWADADPDVPVTLTRENPRATYPRTFPIQLDSPETAAPYPLGMGNNKFPFGGFARNGDILRVPFIGAYSITTAGGAIYEINTISMDASFAEDTFQPDDPPQFGDNGSIPREQVGRFCPINERTGPQGTVDDYSNDPNEYSYAWAKDLFDYLTVDAPSHDNLPDVNRELYSTTFSNPAPQPVKNGIPLPATDAPVPPPGTAALGSEDAVPLHGLININTAPWYVLSAIPWVRTTAPGTTDDKFTFDDSTGQFTRATNGIDDNIDIAKAIVAFRDGSPTLAAGEPFQTIFDLYKVTDRSSPPVNVFRTVQQDITRDGTVDPDDSEGDFTPFNLATPPPPLANDQVKFDYEEQYLVLTRVSNLLTTRSDSFIVYMVVQGWRNVGTAAPELVVQRRAAFILDRSAATATDSATSTLNVPSD